MNFLQGVKQKWYTLQGVKTNLPFLIFAYENILVEKGEHTLCVT
jgi:hypothetical protein